MFKNYFLESLTPKYQLRRHYKTVNEDISENEMRHLGIYFNLFGAMYTLPCMESHPSGVDINFYEVCSERASRAVFGF